MYILNIYRVYAIVSHSTLTCYFVFFSFFFFPSTLIKENRALALLHLKATNGNVQLDLSTIFPIGLTSKANWYWKCKSFFTSLLVFIYSIHFLLPLFFDSFEYCLTSDKSLHRLSIESCSRLKDRFSSLFHRLQNV